MRKEKTILDKVKSLKNNAIMSPAIYRLLTYVKWESIPEEYKSFFPEAAKTVWNDDLKLFKIENILLDLDTELKAVYKILMNRYIVQATALIPIILADVFILGYPITRYETKLKKLIDTFIDNLEYGRNNTEYAAMLDIIDLLEQIVYTLDLEIKEDLVSIHKRLLDKYTHDLEPLRVLNNPKEEENVSNKTTTKLTNLQGVSNVS